MHCSSLCILLDLLAIGIQFVPVWLVLLSCSTVFVSLFTHILDGIYQYTSLTVNFLAIFPVLRHNFIDRLFFTFVYIYPLFYPGGGSVAYIVYLVRIVYLPYPVDHSELLRLYTHTHIHPYSSTFRTVCVRSN